MKQVILASRNAHKLEELKEMVAKAGAALSLKPASLVGGMPEVVEDAGTFVGNARKKAVALVDLIPEDTWALADDSGLCVDALDGGPGVYSARFAGESASDEENNAKLLSLLESKEAEERKAHFVCVLVVRNKEGEEFVFEGRSRGLISTAPKGSGGFGYDPIFIPEGYSESFAVLPPEVKEKRSHRARAFQELLEVF